MNSNYLRVSLIFAALWLSRSRCEFYCDENFGICLYIDYANVATSWKDAQNQCSRNGSILLEIYNEIYANVTRKAFGKFLVQEWYLLLGLEYINRGFRWLTTKEVTMELPVQVIGQFGEGCKAFLIWNGTHLHIEPSSVKVVQKSRFVCLKNSTSITSTSLLATSYIGKNSTHSTTHNSNKNQTHEKQHYNNIEIGVGAGLGLIISLIILIIFIVKWRLMKRKKSGKIVENSEESSLPPTNSPSGTSVIYSDLDFTGNISESKENYSSENQAVYNDDKHP